MKILAKNKKAFFDYEILDTLNAGIKLQGQEVKAVKNGQMQLKGSYVTFYKNALYLAHAHIGAYKHASRASLASYSPERFRKLLVTKKQLHKLLVEKQEKRLLIIPIEVFSDHGFVKIKIALAKPKRKYDKRRRRKEREEKRKVQRIKRMARNIDKT